MTPNNSLLVEKYTFKPYSEQFPILFEKEKTQIVKLLNKLSIEFIIEHFGSTSIPGVGGKGIIDIYLLVDSSNLELISQVLQQELGYEYKESGGTTGRLFHQVIRDTQKYHLHQSDFNSENFTESIAFRDFLRKKPDEAIEYSKIKQKASEVALTKSTKEEMKQSYMKVKQPFIDGINSNVQTNKK